MTWGYGMHVEDALTELSGISSRGVGAIVNRRNTRGNMWSVEEKARARKLRGSGMTYPEIAMALGKGRTAMSVNAMFRREWESTQPRTPRRTVIDVSSDVLIAARDQRLNEPRTVTQILMGDPPLSQSALMRKPEPQRGRPITLARSVQ